MSLVTEGHTTLDDHDPSRILAWIHPASKASVDHVLAQDENDEDGRSNWVWVRLPNGDLILGVFPQGDTYFEVEVDAEIPTHLPNAPVNPAKVEAARKDLLALLGSSDG